MCAVICWLLSAKAIWFLLNQITRCFCVKYLRVCVMCVCTPTSGLAADTSRASRTPRISDWGGKLERQLKHSCQTGSPLPPFFTAIMITIIISVRMEKDSNLVGDAETKAGLHHHCVGRVRTEPGHLSINRPHHLHDRHHVMIISWHFAHHAILLIITTITLHLSLCSNGSLIVVAC